ncbi:MAG: hypothetical protein ACTSUR_06255 [Candidatus Heimdallarchaeaceae archaeon]
MVSNLSELIIKLVQVAIITVILIYFLFRRYKDKITGFSWFIYIFGLILFQSIIELIFYSLTLKGLMESGSSIQEAHMIPAGIALFLLFLYFEYIRHEKPNSIFLGIASLLLGSYIIIFILEVTLGLDQGVPAEYRISRVFYNVLQALVLADVFYVFLKDFIIVRYKKLKQISLILSVATGIAFLAAVFKIFERLTRDTFTIYGAIPFSITFGILAITFIANPFYVYLLPTNINKILIFNDAGILLYSVRIGELEKEKSEDILFSGIVTALKSLIAETTGTRAELKKVSFRDKNMLIVENEQRNITTLIVSDSDSFILQTAAKQFTEHFCARFKHVLERFDGTISIFDEASDLVKRIFPFVPPEEISKE